MSEAMTHIKRISMNIKMLLAVSVLALVAFVGCNKKEEAKKEAAPAAEVAPAAAPAVEAAAVPAVAAPAAAVAPAAAEKK